MARRASASRHAQLTSRHHTVPLCPSYVPIRSPLSANHTQGLWSLEAVKSRSPSRLYFTIVSGRSWPWTMIGRTLFFTSVMLRFALSSAAARAAAVPPRVSLTTCLAPGSTSSGGRIRLAEVGFVRLGRKYCYSCSFYRFCVCGDAQSVHTVLACFLNSGGRAAYPSLAQRGHDTLKLSCDTTQ